MDPLPWYRIAAVPAVGLALIAYAVWKPTTRAHACLLGLAVLSGYGMIQDQVSARLCPEYFTVLHHPIPGLTDPTLLGLAWGFLASAGGGIAMGYAAGLAATLGTQPPLTARELVRPLLLTVLAVGVATAVTGLAVAHVTGLFGVRLDPALDPHVPPDRRRGLVIVACYHVTAYAAAVVGSVALCVWVGCERARRGRHSSTSMS